MFTTRAGEESFTRMFLEIRYVCIYVSTPPPLFTTCSRGGGEGGGIGNGTGGWGVLRECGRVQLSMG